MEQLVKVVFSIITAQLTIFVIYLLGLGLFSGPESIIFTIAVMIYVEASDKEK